MSDRNLFRWSAAAALLFHAALLFFTDGVHGGGDLKPHLRLIQLMGEDPALRSVYAPAYHVIGALVAPLSGLDHYPEWFAWCSAAALIGAFRWFQRAAGLPDAASALFAWAPYHFALTRCLPKVEAAGYALMLVGLALVLRKQRVGLALCLALTFTVHTAAALVLGLVGGVLALSQRDRRALVALAAGTALALPLPIAHLAAGCTLAEAFLFSDADYLRAAPRAFDRAYWDRVLLLANPLALVAASLGAKSLWRQHRPAAVACLPIVALYLNEIWLAPFGARTTLDALRGLTLLAIPVAAAGGIAIAQRDRLTQAVVATCAAIAISTSIAVVPDACMSKPIAIEGISALDVDRCTFRWRLRAPDRAPQASGRRTERLQVGADDSVERTAPLERAPQ